MKNLFILSILYISSVFVSSCSKDEQILKVGDKLQHDDFFYSVQKSLKTKEFVTAKANGDFYVLMFKVQNDAKRVDHNWKRDVVYVVDESGREYENLPQLEMEYANINYEKYRESFVTKPGTSDSTVLVFDLPENVKEVYVKYRGDFLMGDLFDGNKFKNTKVKLN